MTRHAATPDAIARVLAKHGRGVDLSVARLGPFVAFLMLAGSVVSCRDRATVMASASASKPLSAVRLALPDTPMPVTSSGEPIVQIKHVDRRGLKGTEVALWFDVTLINDRPEPRWFLVPATLAKPTWIGAVSSLQVTELRGAEGKVVIGRGQYFEGSFQALLMAPNAKVTIRKLSASIYAKSLLTSVPFDVVTATEVRMGTEPLQKRFPVDPTATGTTDVEDDRWQIGKFELEGYRTPDEKEVPVQASIDRQLRVTVPIL